MTTNNALNANTNTPLPIVDGGTGVNAVTTAPTATAWAGWDANKNLSANNNLEAYTTTATAAGTTVLTVASTYQQFFTGTTTQTVTLPVVSTLVLGQTFLIVNNSTGVVTVQSSGANTVTAMAAGSQAIFTCILTTGTTAASWSSDYSLNTVGVASITGTANQVIASASTGAVTLSLPQSIATTSDVTFDSVTFSNTAKGISGTTAANNAGAGYVGEVISNSATAQAISNGGTINVTSINLTAGDWDVFGVVNTTVGASTLTQTLLVGTNTTTVTLPSFYAGASNSAAGYSIGVTSPTVRINVSSTTTVYLVAIAGYTISTLSLNGSIYARRMR